MNLENMVQPNEVVKGGEGGLLGEEKIKKGLRGGVGKK